MKTYKSLINELYYQHFDPTTQRFDGTVDINGKKVSQHDLEKADFKKGTKFFFVQSNQAITAKTQYDFSPGQTYQVVSNDSNGVTITDGWKKFVIKDNDISLLWFQGWIRPVGKIAGYVFEGTEQKQQYLKEDKNPGDFVDFGSYGQFYILKSEGDSYRVTDEKKDRYNPDASGWLIKKSYAVRGIQKAKYEYKPLTESAVDIANTIRQQIIALDKWALGAWGATEAKALNAGNVVYDTKTGVQHKIPYGALSFKVKGSKFMGYIVVSLNGRDLYDIFAYRLRGAEMKIVVEKEDIFVEDLVQVLDGIIG